MRMRIAYASLIVLGAVFLYALVVPNLSDLPNTPPDYESRVIIRE